MIAGDKARHVDLTKAFPALAQVRESLGQSDDPDPRDAWVAATQLLGVVSGSGAGTLLETR